MLQSALGGVWAQVAGVGVAVSPPCWVALGIQGCGVCFCLARSREVSVFVGQLASSLPREKVGFSRDKDAHLNVPADPSPGQGGNSLKQALLSPFVTRTSFQH